MYIVLQLQPRMASICCLHKGFGDGVEVQPSCLGNDPQIIAAPVSDMRVIGELSENQRVTRGSLYLVTGQSRTILDGPRLLGGL
jgi:hypothetical protein